MQSWILLPCLWVSLPSSLFSSVISWRARSHQRLIKCLSIRSFSVLVSRVLADKYSVVENLHITTHIVPRKHFFEIFYKFWSECFRIYTKSRRHVFCILVVVSMSCRNDNIIVKTTVIFKWLTSRFQDIRG